LFFFFKWIGSNIDLKNDFKNKGNRSKKLFIDLKILLGCHFVQCEKFLRYQVKRWYEMLAINIRDTRNNDLSILFDLTTESR